MEYQVDPLRKQTLDDTFDAFSMLARGNYVSLYDMKAKLTRYSPGAVELFGLPGEYIPDGVYDWADYIHPEDRRHYLAVMGKLISGETHAYDITYRVRTKEGGYGSFRFFVLEGEALDKPKQFTGTSIVICTDTPCRDAVERSVLDGFEPHFVVMKGRHAAALRALADMYGFPVYAY